MNNLEIYKSVFADVLELAEDELESAAYKIAPEWTSLNHLALVTEIETKFGCSFSPQEIMEFHTFQKGVEILTQKGICF